MAIDNLLAIEDDIVAVLQGVSGILEIYREVLDNGLTNTTVQVPCILLEFAGLAPGDADSRVTAQLVKTLWTLRFVCVKEDYKSVAGVKLLEILGVLNGYEADAWFGPAKLYARQNDDIEPYYAGGLAFYPMTFAIDVVTKKCRKKIL